MTRMLAPWVLCLALAVPACASSAPPAERTTPARQPAERATSAARPTEPPPGVGSAPATAPASRPVAADPQAAADSDGDGIPDAQDKCPNQPEDRDGYQDEDGCPDPDNDGDGIPDVQDKCPLAPETRNGIADDDGCPD